MAAHEITNHFYNTKTLVAMWGAFIDWEKRRKGENGFLVDTLRRHGCARVFEATLGDGCDAIYLVKNGFDVTSNEIDALFAAKARANARREHVRLTITAFDWLELDSHFAKGSFDAVLCLGNSLTYLFRRSEQLRALRNFRFLLRKGGILVVDERNYHYLLDERKAILRGHFRYSGKYVYCGTRVHGRPVEIEDNKVVMEYEDTATEKKAYLVLYPFKQGELLGLLKGAGFRTVTRSSDFAAGFDPRADFYQYCAVA